MKVLFSVSHPAQVHVVKNICRSLEKRGHDYLILGSHKEIVEDLLKRFDLKYILVAKNRKKLLMKVWELIKSTMKSYVICKKFQPDIVFGTGYYAAYAAKMLDIPVISQGDSEPALKKIGKWLFLPFNECVLVPECYGYDFGPKMVKYQGYKELTYLHPNNFSPDWSACEDLGIKSQEIFFILRFVSWDAAHDIGQYGFNDEYKFKIVELLKNYGKVFISSEARLPSYFEKYRVEIKPDKMHHLLSFSSLFIGDSQTMATESAILGIPAVRCNSWVGSEDMANFIELENKYKLLYSFSNPKAALEKLSELLATSDLKKEWTEKRNNLLRDKEDCAKIMTNFIMNFPNSYTNYFKNKTLNL